MRLLLTATTRGSALRGSERGEGAPASNEPGQPPPRLRRPTEALRAKVGCGAEPHVIKALENRREV